MDKANLQHRRTRNRDHHHRTTRSSVVMPRFDRLLMIAWRFWISVRAVILIVYIDANMSQLVELPQIEI